MKLSILVLAKNEAKNIGQCLEAIYSQDYGGEVEVVVIDSGSTDGTVEIAGRFSVRIESIPPESFHHARTRNLAASLASGDLLVFLAADAIPASKMWLQSLASNFTDPCVGAVYGRHLPKQGASPERRVALETLYGDERIVKRAQGGIPLGYKYYHFSTVNAAIRKTVWESTRFPDDLRVFEDVGIAKRMLDSGWQIVYEPRASVFHSHDYPLGILFRRYFDIGVVYSRLGIWNKRSSATVRQDGWRSVQIKLNKLARQEGLFCAASSVFTDLAKFTAIGLGRNERVLPIALKKKLSLFKLFD